MAAMRHVRHVGGLLAGILGLLVLTGFGVLTAGAGGGGASAAEFATSTADAVTIPATINSTSNNATVSTLLASNWLALSRLQLLNQPISVTANPLPTATGTSPPEKIAMKFDVFRTTDQGQRDQSLALLDKVLGEFDLWELPMLDVRAAGRKLFVH
jgi:hypothetical protein